MKQGDASSAKSKETNPSSASSAKNNADDPPSQDALKAEFREDDKGMSSKIRATNIFLHFSVFFFVLQIKYKHLPG